MLKNDVYAFRLEAAPAPPLLIHTHVNRVHELDSPDKARYGHTWLARRSVFIIDYNIHVRQTFLNIYEATLRVDTRFLDSRHPTRKMRLLI